MKEMISRAEATPAQELWLADVAVYQAGEKRSLIQARSTGATCLVHATYAELLRQCREFKTLDEHLYAFYHQKQLRGTPMSAEVVQGLRAKLQQLAREGYLIPESLMQSLFSQTDEPAPPPHITTIGIPTCNRVEIAQLALTSYLEHCQRFGRSPEFVVMDDSPSSSTREAYREMLRSLKQRYGMSIAYAGLEEKTAYVRKLSEAGKIPEEIVSWTCLGDRTYGKSTLGANRNALLLHTIGECIFSSDDDLMCRVAASPGFQEGLAIRSRNPIQYWCYSDRERALEAVPSVEQDIFALHEQWLGHDPKEAGVPYSQAGQLSLEQVEPTSLRRFAMQAGKIALTMNGIVGDVCFGTTDFLLFSADESFKRLTSSEETYRLAKTSRETAQAVKRLTLVPNPELPLGAYMGGLDNRALLPPFLPVGPIEDNAFGLTLNRCFPDAYAVYLPWVLLHTPPEVRAYENPIFNAGGRITRSVSFYEWLPRCIGLFHLDQVSTPADHLSQLGLFLEHLGRLSISAFEEFARHLLWQSEGGMISQLEQRIRGNETFLDSYRQDVEAYCAQARQCMLLPIKQRLKGGAELAQRSFVQFAQILHWWPTMVETARGLRADGIGVAQPL